MSEIAAPREVAVCYHHAIPRAQEVAERLARRVRASGGRAAVMTLPHPGPGPGASRFAERLASADLLICVGGDGTVLHASEFAAIGGTPILGVRMGRLGFLTEATESEAEAALGVVLERGARIERRSMVQASVGDAAPMHALNDVVIGRARLGRTVSVGARVDGVLVAEYRADAVVVATATGSTGYALSVGGPILYPTSRELLVVPVAPHLTRANALVLPSTAVVRLYVARGEAAVMTVDGIHERPVSSGTLVEVATSPQSVGFVRLGGENQFYANLAQRLGWLRLDHVMDDADPGAGGSP
ncbi:MAG: NAD(+)/NADH kinase [Chloroflexi bacterium]|nr:NAD(+)/NADH kinase [Chloroflexota bacterium]